MVRDQTHEIILKFTYTGVVRKMDIINILTKSYGLSPEHTANTQSHAGEGEDYLKFLISKGEIGVICR